MGRGKAAAVKGTGASTASGSIHSKGCPAAHHPCGTAQHLLLLLRQHLPRQAIQAAHHSGMALIRGDPHSCLPDGCTALLSSALLRTTTWQQAVPTIQGHFLCQHRMPLLRVQSVRQLTACSSFSNSNSSRNYTRACMKAWQRLLVRPPPQLVLVVSREGTAAGAAASWLWTSSVAAPVVLQQHLLHCLLLHQTQWQQHSSSWPLEAYHYQRHAAVAGSAGRAAA